MNVKSCIATALICLLGLATCSRATVRRVGTTELYHTISSAYSVAVNNDTILISPSVYNENIECSKRITFIGNGFDNSSQTVINGHVYISSGSTGTTFEGLIMNTDGNGVLLYNNVGDITIRRCLIYVSAQSGRCVYRSEQYNGKINIEDCILRSNGNNQYPIITLNSDTLLVRNTIFASDTYAYAIGGVASSVILQNCVFLNLHTAFSLTGSFPMLIANNIFFDFYSPTTPRWGTYPASSTWEYNLSSGFAPPGPPSAVLTTSPFDNYNSTTNYVHGTTNLHLHQTNGLPCINTGQPALLDLDGSRSDLGIYGGLTPFVDSGAPSYPFVTGLTVPGAITAGQPLPFTSTGRIGRGY